MKKALGRAPTQTGAALLTAMLLVMLVATVTATSLWQQRQATDVEYAERQGIQARWLMKAATDWARLVLREDARSSNTDNLNEPWAIAIQPIPLERMLGNSGAELSNSTPQASIAGYIEDDQARYNLRNLIKDNKLDRAQQDIVQRLWLQLSLPREELGLLLTQLAASSASNDNLQKRGMLLPQKLEDFRQWGLSEKTLLTLRPYATWLTQETSININTATAPVISSVLNISAEQTRNLLGQRSRRPFKTLTELQDIIGKDNPTFGTNNSATSSRYFSIHIQISMDELSLAQVTQVQRDGDLVRIIRVSPDSAEQATPPTQQTTSY